MNQAEQDITYSRAAAHADGTLIAVPETLARTSGFRIPVALTRTAWETAVGQDNTDTGEPDGSRLWDVLLRALRACRADGDTPSINFTIDRDTNGTIAQVPLTVRISRGDHGEPVLTIMTPGED